jgi:hypothetical protein
MSMRSLRDARDGASRAALEPSAEGRARSVPIEAEARRRCIALAVSGHVLRGACPSCGGELKLWPARQQFFCSGGIAGDTINFVQHVDRLRFSEAVELLTKPAEASR